MSRKKATAKHQKDTLSFSQKSTSAVKSFSNRKAVLWLAFLILAITVVAYYPNHSSDYDIWWHLKYGEHFVKNGTWNIDHTAYSWTPTDGNWRYVTWIGSSFLYLIFRAAAYPGLHILQLVILSGIIFFFLLYIRCTGDTVKIIHVTYLLLAVVALNPTAIFLKPELFTILFFTSVVFIYFISKLYSRNFFFLYPILFLIWVNTHGGFIIGMFFVTLVLFCEVFNFLFIKNNHLTRNLVIRFAVFVILSYAVLLINPYGIRYPLETILNLTIGETSHFEALTAYINRWQYLFPSVYVFRRTNTAWVLLFMQASVIFMFIYAYARKRFLDITLIVINLAFFYFSMQMARATLYFPVIWLFSMHYVLYKSEALHITYRLAPLASVIFIVVSGICMYNTVALNTDKSWFGSHMDELVPLNEVDYILDNDLPGPLFNDYLTGGYMIWSMYPKYKVFLDPRHTPYLKGGVWDDYAGLRQRPDQAGFNNFTGKYPFRTALINHAKYSELVIAFLQSPDWQLVYFDKIAAVFVLKSAVTPQKLQSLQTDFGTERFQNLTNPMILYSLFNVYYLINVDKAREIVYIYENNVSNLFAYKKRHIASMNGMLLMK